MFYQNSNKKICVHLYIHAEMTSN